MTVHAERIVLEHREGRAYVQALGAGRRRVTVEVDDPSAVIPFVSADTGYDVRLIGRLLEVKGPQWLCDEILRDEDPGYVRRQIEFGILPYVDETAIDGSRLLDFGCGSGASTVILGRMFPGAEIVGVDLDEQLLSIARRRVAHYGLGGISLLRSPDGSRLPADIGTFDFVCLSAVFEHLLPAERKTIFPMLWSVLRPGGVMFLFETPHRWNLVESHTTGLPINYLPDRLAHACATRFSRRVRPDADWTTLLRQGIRGGSEREVLRLLQHAPGTASLLPPTRLGLHDAVDLWYAKGQGGGTPRRRLLRSLLKIVNRLAGGGFVPYLYIAVRKVAGERGV